MSIPRVVLFACTTFDFPDLPTAPFPAGEPGAFLSSRSAHGDADQTSFFAEGERPPAHSDAALGELAGAFPQFAVSPEKWRICPVEAQP